MPERLYYTDAYQTTFSARVVDVDVPNALVYLDGSAFYPTSGGQPHDIGTLAASVVLDVIDEDARVAHRVADASAFTIGSTVEGRIDWRRRFDLMQQHTAQHLVSALCADRFGWATTSVHFGDDSCTIDVAAPAIDAETLASIEQMANEVVVENRNVVVSFEDARSATGLRKPSDREGELRIVAIDGIDRSACGGTHVRRTGEIGSIVLRRTERTKGATRIEFLAGFRAVRRARLDYELLTRASRTLSASIEELPALVEAHAQRATEMERERKRLLTELAKHEAHALWAATVPGADGTRRITLPEQMNGVRDAEPLAQALAALERTVVFAAGRKPAGVLLATSSDSMVDAAQLLRSALQEIGGRGGGSPRLAQGSVPDLDAARRLRSALGFAD